MNKRRVLFIINPISGGRDKSKIADLIPVYLDGNYFDFDIKYTEYIGHGAKIARKYHDKFDVIVAVGGDGTINEIAKEIAGTQAALAIIPQGSGNGLARHLNWELDTKKAILQMNNAETSAIDTAELNGHFFVSIAGVGFDSLIAEKFAHSKNRGFVGYASLSIKEFFKYQEQEYDLLIDGQKFKRKAAMISIANSNQFGYNTKISPLASLCDGLLDVCIIRKPKLVRVPQVLSKVWSAKAHESNLIEIIRGKKIQISPNDNEYANVDGESLKVGKKVEIVMNPRNLKIWLPKV
ncbi:diacylglycerol kinase family protein [Lentimicrobium sp. S6]|uniref:diacylglycerol/lipid kinase family protein n=1 Tax=Lentimicrobium sp. S6 TaxID=2735872 RepID=UPI0015518374|nr:YegS/Rv2252/BmrU family lipid kinase [Lentimicrobium sp. S6]NPD46206.1 YegS/Rv2252/BmrU family lipid kinase [Lentimicrobium sp. S6]